MPPRTMVTMPLAVPNSSAKPISAALLSNSANSVNDSGMPASTTRPTLRSDKCRPSHA